MKCLSIQQPYATAIVRGLRSYEGRTWRTGYTGPLLIHAGKQNYEGSETVMHGGQKWLVSAYRDVGIPHPIAHGAIVGVVWLDGMGANSTEDYWYWELSRPQEFRVIVPWRGRQKLFEVTPEEVESLALDGHVVDELRTLLATSPRA